MLCSPPPLVPDSGMLAMWPAPSLFFLKRPLFFFFPERHRALLGKAVCLCSSRGWPVQHGSFGTSHFFYKKKTQRFFFRDFFLSYTRNVVAQVDGGRSSGHAARCRVLAFLIYFKTSLFYYFVSVDLVFRKRDYACNPGKEEIFVSYLAKPRGQMRCPLLCC